MKKLIIHSHLILLKMMFKTTIPSNGDGNQVFKFLINITARANNDIINIK